LGKRIGDGKSKKRRAGLKKEKKDLSHQETTSEWEQHMATNQYKRKPRTQPGVKTTETQKPITNSYKKETSRGIA